MLEGARKTGLDSKKKILATILFGFIVIVFVFMGVIPDQSGSSGSGTAATVNGTVISYYDLQERLRMLEQQYGQNMNNLPAAQRRNQMNELRQSAINQLVDSQIAFQSARKEGLAASPEAISDMIFNISAFQEDGKFKRERYFNYLEYVKMSPGEFESKMEKDVVIGQLREMFVTSLKNPERQLVYDGELEQVKLNIEFAKLDTMKLTGGVTDAQVKELLSKEEGLAQVKARYEAQKQSDFTSKAEVRARHILIKGTDDAALKKIEGIRAQVEKGDFAKIAGKVSEDEGTKVKGGDLGFFGRGQMVPEFESAAFTLPVGKISEPVKSMFGYHLIKVEERRGGETKTLEQVQDQIAKQILADENKDKILAQINEALKGNQSVDSLIRAQGVKWEETGDFALNQYAAPKIEAGDEVITAALQLKPGQTHNQLIRAGTIAYVIRLKKISVPSVVKPSDRANSMWGMAGGGLESLNNWLQENRKQAKISINEQIVNQ